LKFSIMAFRSFPPPALSGIIPTVVLTFQLDEVIAGLDVPEVEPRLVLKNEGEAKIWLAFRALTDYRFVGLGWMLHVGWDILHHLYGHPILPFIPLSSFGCAVCDTGIAIWYFLGAPSVWKQPTKLQAAAHL